MRFAGVSLSLSLALFLILGCGSHKQVSDLATEEIGVGIDKNSPPVKAVSEGSGPGDWWMFGREPTHNRRSPFRGPGKARLRWKYQLPTEPGQPGPKNVKRLALR